MAKKIAIWLVAALALAIFAQTPQAASQMSLGTVTSVSLPLVCPSGRGFINEIGNCYTATLSGCPGNDDLPFWFGVATPSVSPNGTIVFFAGDGGGYASDGVSTANLLSSYVRPPANYQVIQIAWGQVNEIDWEFTNVNGGGHPASILNAACRPASFLHWVRNSSGFWGGGGMCAQGHSAGSAALAYALAWYNAGADLDKALFTSGPVFSDIGRGCEVPNNQYTYICQGSGQYGCSGWSILQDPPGFSLEYTSGYKSEVNDWTGNSALLGAASCANNSSPTSAVQDSSWFQMSILYNLGTQQPSFNYPHTAISAWLCETVAPGVPVNNSAAQGQLYWANFTSSTQAGSSLSVNAVTSCPETEDVLDGTVAATGHTGSVDILSDMADLSNSNRCMPRH
jgi:hypothetical protein